MFSDTFLNSVATQHQLDQSNDERLNQSLRILATDILSRAGILLKLPISTIVTSQILLQRFYYTASFRDFPLNDVILACIFLASKVEETPRKVSDIINVFWYIVCQMRGKLDPSFKFSEEKYYESRFSLLDAEGAILSHLGFNVQVNHPHSLMINYAKALDLAENVEFIQMAWNYLNDCMRTAVAVCYQPPTIACAVIYLSASKMSLALPSNPPWWELFDTIEDDLQAVGSEIAKLYSITIDYSLLEKYGE